MALIPYPIPENDRKRLMEAGKHALEAFGRNAPDAWRSRHSKVEKIIEEIQAKYGVVHG